MSWYVGGVRRSATKQMLVYAAPAVLTLHLKRFEQVGSSLRRLSRHVDFSELLDLAPYCSRLAEVVSLSAASQCTASDAAYCYRCGVVSVRLSAYSYASLDVPWPVCLMLDTAVSPAKLLNQSRCRFGADSLRGRKEACIRREVHTGATYAQYQMRPVATDVAWSVGLSVCLL